MDRDGNARLSILLSMVMEDCTKPNGTYDAPFSPFYPSIRKRNTFLWDFNLLPRSHSYSTYA